MGSNTKSVVERAQQSNGLVRLYPYAIEDIYYQHTCGSVVKTAYKIIDSEFTQLTV